MDERGSTLAIHLYYQAILVYARNITQGHLYGKNFLSIAEKTDFAVAKDFLLREKPAISMS